MKLPEAYWGKWFILFSHPGDFTPVCTTEFVAFYWRYDRFRELNCELIDLYIDQTFSHLKWVESGSRTSWGRTLSSLSSPTT